MGKKKSIRQRGKIQFSEYFKDIKTGRGYFHNNPIRDFLIIGIK